MCASSTSSLQGSLDKPQVTTPSAQLLHRLLADNLDVVRVWSFAPRFCESSLNTPNDGYVVPFPLIDR